MTKKRSKAAKRKDTSAHESDLPDAKKRVSAETCNASTFTRDLLKSLNDPDVRAAYQSILTDALLERISNLEEQVAENNTRIVSLEDELKTVRREKDVLEEDLHELRQYTRRNALRIYNPLWKEPPPPRPGQQGEDTDSLVLGLAHQLGVPLEPWEIGRSHRVGKPRNDGTPRPVIVKFISYNIRSRIYEGRKRMKDIPAMKNTVFINEDLTRENGKLAYEAPKLKNQNLLADTFTRDGRIYVKRYVNQRPKAIRNFDHLLSVAHAPSYQQMATGVNPAGSEVVGSATTKGSNPGVGGRATTMNPRHRVPASDPGVEDAVNTQAAPANATETRGYDGSGARPKTSTPQTSPTNEDSDPDATTMSASILPQNEQYQLADISIPEMNNAAPISLPDTSENEMETNPLDESETY